MDFNKLFYLRAAYPVADEAAHWGEPIEILTEICQEVDMEVINGQPGIVHTSRSSVPPIISKVKYAVRIAP